MDNNEIINEKLMRELKNRLDMSMYNYLKYDTDFEFYGSKKDESYNFYNKSNLRYEEKSIRLDLKFKVCYEQPYDIYCRDRNKIDTSRYTEDELNIIDDEIEKASYNKSDINYVIISGLYINPKGTGIGTKLMKIFIDELKEIDKLEYIFLHPRDERAEIFWSRLGFVNCYVFNKSIKDIDFGIMALDLRNYPSNNFKKDNNNFII